MLVAGRLQPRRDAPASVTGSTQAVGQRLPVPALAHRAAQPLARGARSRVPHPLGHRGALLGASAAASAAVIERTTARSKMRATSGASTNRRPSGVSMTMPSKMCSRALSSTRRTVPTCDAVGRAHRRSAGEHLVADGVAVVGHHASKIDRWRGPELRIRSAPWLSDEAVLGGIARCSPLRRVGCRWLPSPCPCVRQPAELVAVLERHRRPPRRASAKPPALPFFELGAAFFAAARRQSPRAMTFLMPLGSGGCRRRSPWSCHGVAREASLPALDGVPSSAAEAARSPVAGRSGGRVPRRRGRHQCVW